jgi:hypothetical protein
VSLSDRVSSGAETRRGPGWLPALGLVACLHLLTAAGTWVVTDQAEALFTARRLVTHGTLDLAEDGARPLPELPWVRGVPGRPLRSRLLPLHALSLVPLVWLDRLLGLPDPVRNGGLVHLQGLLYVLATLALLAFAVRRSTGSDAAATLAVVLTGLCWPVWMVSHDGGAEPVLMLLVMIVVGLGPDGADLPGSAPAAARLVACLLLPWTNPVGGALAGALALAAWTTGRESRAGAVAVTAGALLGILSAAGLWNLWRNGSLLVGGYQPWAGSRGFFLARNPLLGVADHVGAALRQAPLLFLGLPLVAWMRGRGTARDLVTPGLLFAAVVALFATFYHPEPARRLAPVWPVFGLALGRGVASLRLPRPLPQAAIGLALLTGCFWFVASFGRYYPGPAGLFYPGVLWVKLALARGWSPLWLLPVALLGAGALASLERAFAVVAGEPGEASPRG